MTGRIIVIGTSIIMLVVTLSLMHEVDQKYKDVKIQVSTPLGKCAHPESINALEDMREWMLWDIEEGRMDSMRGVSYLNVFDELIVNLKTTQDVK